MEIVRFARWILMNFVLGVMGIEIMLVMVEQH